MPKKTNSQKQHQQQHAHDTIRMPPSPKATNVDPASPSSYAHVAQDGAPPSHHAPPSPPQSTVDDKERLQQQGYELVGRAIEAYPAGKPYSTGIDEAPTTLARAPYIPGDNDPLLDPGTARATIAASREAPNGTVEGGWARKHQDKTVLQQHAHYFDTDNDGVIWPRDTFAGCRRWGWSVPLSAVVAVVIHAAFSYPTVPHTLVPDPFFRIHQSRIHKDKYGCDTGSYDNEGRFRSQQFEDVFAKYDAGAKGGLDGWDAVRMIRGHMAVLDLFGAIASSLKWIATYLLLWPDDGIMRKDDVRRVYDGSIFQYKADQYASRQRRAQPMHGRLEGFRKQAGAWWSQVSAKSA